MSDSENNAPIAALPTTALPPAAFEDGAGQPLGVAVIFHMRPERILHGAEDEACAVAAEAQISKRYRTGSFTFASDFLARAAELASEECHGLGIRPSRVEVTFLLDEKAYRQVGAVLESFDRAYRGL